NFYSNIPNSENITIDQMLSMTSGLFLENKLKNSQSKEESINYVVNNVTYQPTDKWRYSDVNFFLLGAIIEKISQTTYEDY
ncbi:serine hydrolase, partial [Staphylococcus aureus]